MHVYAKSSLKWINFGLNLINLFHAYIIAAKDEW